MGQAFLAQDHHMISRLLSKHFPTADQKLWCVLSAEWTFDGNRLPFDGTPAELDEIRNGAEWSARHGDKFVIWMPRQKRQRGRIPRGLRCGYTVFLDGTDLVIFQSVVYVPRPGQIDLIATTRTGQFVSVPRAIVAAWDGTAVDEPANINSA